MGIKLGNGNYCYAKIDDGPWITYTGVGDILNLTPNPLPDGTHTLIFTEGRDHGYEFFFKGLVLDPGASTLPPAVEPALIEFIGDSISCGFKNSQANVSAYSWIVAEKLNCEHTQIAYPGIAMVTGYGTGSVPCKKGMDDRYFSSRISTFFEWDFNNYTPDIIVINIGTNDRDVQNDTFQNTYTTFLEDIREKFPDTEIFAMKLFDGRWEKEIQASVETRKSAGDNSVHYIDTTGWLKGSGFGDGTHPSDAGHIKAADLLAPILKPYLSK